MGQNNTKAEFEALPFRQRLFIDFKAVEGLMIEATTVKSVSMESFALSIGVKRNTLYRWKDEIPNFWELVGYRRPILMQQRIGIAYKGLTMKAATGNPTAVALLLNQFGELKPRVDKSEVTHVFPQPILGGTAGVVIDQPKQITDGV